MNDHQGGMKVDKETERCVTLFIPLSPSVALPVFTSNWNVGWPYQLANQNNKQNFRRGDTRFFLIFFLVLLVYVFYLFIYKFLSPSSMFDLFTCVFIVIYLFIPTPRGASICKPTSPTITTHSRSVKPRQINFLLLPHPADKYSLLLFGKEERGEEALWYNNGHADE